jgi:hypothetical protein
MAFPRRLAGISVCLLAYAPYSRLWFSGTATQDIPFRFLTCLVSGLAYYLALKIPEALNRLEPLKQMYDEAWDLAAGEDREKAPDRLVPRRMYIS